MLCLCNAIGAAYCYALHIFLSTIYLTITTMVWSKKNKDPLTNITNPVGGGIRSNKRLTHTNQPTLLTTLKHLSILSIITSLLLVLTINIYRTYSYTNTLTKAVESTNQPTQSESTNQTSSSNNTNTTCNSSNPNAPVCIALSIKSSSSATGDSSLTMAIPEQGGIVTHGSNRPK